MRFKRFLSACMSAVMLLTSVNFAWAGENDAKKIEADISSYAENTTRVIIKDIPGFGDGKSLEDGYDLTNGMSIWILSNWFSPFAQKSLNAVFNNGERVFTVNDGEYNVIQMGNGNSKIPEDDVQVGYMPYWDVEKGIRIVVDEAKYIKVYGAISRSDVTEAKFALIEEETYEVVDVKTAIREENVYKDGVRYVDSYIPTLVAPKAGTYYFFIPGNATGLNIFEIDTTPYDGTQTVGHPIPNTMAARINGPSELEYNEDKKAYSKESFDLRVTAERTRLILQNGNNPIPSGNVKVKLTAPNGFSFSSSGDDNIMEYDSEVNVSKNVTVYLKSPKVGKHTFNAELTNAQGNVYNSEYTVNVVKTGFNEEIYKANHNITKGYAVDNIEEFVINRDTPAEILKKAADENGMDLKSISWDVLNKSFNAVDNPSKVMDYALEEKEMYTAMLFEMLDCKIENTVDDVVNDKKLKDFKTFESTIIDELKDIYTYDELTNSFFTDKDRQERAMEVVNNRFKEDFPDIADTEEINKIFFEPMEYAGNFFDITERVYNYCKIRMVDDSIKQMLENMYKETPSENVALKGALYETKSVIEASEAEFIGEMAACSLQMAGKDALQHGVKEIWKKAKNKAYEAYPALALIHAIIKGGQFVSESVFNTSKITEAYYKLGVVNNIGLTVNAAYNNQKRTFKANKTEANAINYNAAVNFLGAYYMLDCDTAKQFPDAVNDAAFSKAFGTSGTKELKSSIEDLKRSMKGFVNNANTDWIEQLSEDYPELYDYYDKNRDKFKVYDIHCPVDVYVFDKNGVLVASVEGESLYYDGEANLTIARKDDKKTVYTYGDEYSVVYKATDNGTMDIIVNEYSNGENTATVNFNDIELVKDAEYKSEENGKYGTEADYSLEKNGAKVLPDYNSNITSPKYMLNIINGLIAETSQQSGEYSAGEKISIITYIPQGASFAGWQSNEGSNVFEDAKAVSTTITMPAANIEITAYVNGAGENFVFGDADGSGKVDASDASMVLQKALSNSYTMPIQGKNADWLKYTDVNVNGKIDADDAANIMQKTLNGSFTMPAERTK